MKTGDYKATLHSDFNRLCTIVSVAADRAVKDTVVVDDPFVMSFDETESAPAAVITTANGITVISTDVDAATLDLMLEQLAVEQLAAAKTELGKQLKGAAYD